MGLLNYPNSFVPDTLAGHTSGTEKASGQTCAETDYASAWCGMELGPFDSVPSVGFSDIEPVLDADGNRVTGEFWCTTDNGFGNSANSWGLSTAHPQDEDPEAVHLPPRRVDLRQVH